MREREQTNERTKGPRATGCDVLVRLNIDTQHATYDDEAAMAMLACLLAGLLARLPTCLSACLPACPFVCLRDSRLSWLASVPPFWTLVKATTAIDSQDRTRQNASRAAGNGDPTSLA